MENVKKNAIDILLSESFKELSKKKPIEKITIKEITNEAGVIRPTFYNHFQDKYELLEWIVKEDLEAPMRVALSQNDFKGGFVNALNKIESEREFYQNAVKLEGQNSFKETFEAAVSRLLVEFMDEQPFSGALQYKWMQKKMIGDMYGGFIAGIVIEWIRLGMKAPKEELAEVTLILLEEPVRL
ncbi:MAG: TetR/AcrR family transcriptional regulator C-terminal domain-containing protein [Lachnospiraceae bacterium]|nr:TetR/AcrR family transcriptional regulator C-terminal domain-containing protein [Lachnospiraceae bacterium]